MNRRQVLAACLACALAGPVAGAAAETPLDRYLSDLATWSADFRLTMKDSRDRTVSGKSGRLIIVRPGKLRWESKDEDSEGELLVADGRNLWHFVRDLEQVTVKPLKEAAAQSPAMLLAGDRELRNGFTVESGGRREGLEWTRVLPRAAQSDFREALFGFRGRELAQLIIVDKLGNRSTLVFSSVRRNLPVDPGLTRFTPPQGTDVIGTPLP